MRRRRPFLFVSLLVATLVVLLTRMEVAEAASLAGCGAWNVVASPNVTAEQNFLQSVTAVSANNTWAVGFTYNSLGVSQTLTEHWNGQQWSIVASPNVSSTNNFLYGIAAVSTNDVWAVGSSGNAGQGPLQTLVEHWDGTRWSVASSPNSQLPLNNLASVTAISANNVWAVGMASVSSGSAQTLVEHWNGHQWALVASPNTGQVFDYLYSVASISATDIWAVGSSGDNSAAVQTLIEHWNGHKWSIVRSANSSLPLNILQGVAAISADDLWAVGYAQDIGGATISSLIEHWNGKEWSVVSDPHPKARNNVLTSIAAISSSDIWAVGSSFNTSNATTAGLIEHWNGHKWSIVASPNPSSSFNTLIGVAALTAQDVWSVGDYLNSNGAYQTLTEFYC